MSDELINWFLVFTRMSGMLSMLPVFSSRAIPVKFRLALGAVIALLCAPLTAHAPWKIPPCGS
jgi:flagellar biosynthesis protein FliR